MTDIKCDQYEVLEVVLQISRRNHDGLETHRHKPKKFEIPRYADRDLIERTLNRVHSDVNAFAADVEADLIVRRGTL